MLNSNVHNGTVPTASPNPKFDSGFQSPLDDKLGYHLRRASTVVLAELAASLADLALRPSEASIILLIEHSPGITQSEIGRILGIKRANMAPLAAMLSDRDLIDRSRQDGRSQGLQLTATGQAVATDIAARMNAHEARLLPDLSASERDALIGLLRRIWTARSATSRRQPSPA